MKSVCLGWNIHTSWEYLKALNTVSRFSKEKNLDNLVKALNFLFAFKNILEKCSSNFNWLSILTHPKVSHYWYLKFYFYLFWPIHVHVLFQKLLNCIYMYLILCSLFLIKLTQLQNFLPTFPLWCKLTSQAYAVVSWAKLQIQYHSIEKIGHLDKYWIEFAQVRIIEIPLEPILSKN